MSRLTIILRRLLQMIPVVLAASVAIFVMVRALPGDPAVIMLTNKATPEQVAALRERMGLSRPVVVQFFYFLRSLVDGNLGDSLFLQTPVTTLIWQAMGATLLLVTMTVIISVLVSVPLAVFSALHRDRWPDTLVRAGTTLGFGMPQFWIGLLLILVLSYRLPVFPVAGYGDTFAEHVWHLILPSVTLSVGLIVVLTRPLRAEILKLLQSEFVEMARAKGVRGPRLMWRHVLRNALVAVVTILGVRIGWLIGGTVVIESVFAIPGLGWLLVHAVTARDYPVIQALTIVFVVEVVLINLLTDLLYTFLDPRVRFD